MGIRRYVSAAAAIAAISTSFSAGANPRDAAFATSADQAERHAALFSGATLRVSLDGRNSKPELALRLAGSSYQRDGASKIGDGLAIGTATDGGARVTIAGQDSEAIGRRLGMSDGAKVALIGGAVVVVGLIVLVASTGTGDAPAAAFE